MNMLLSAAVAAAVEDAMRTHEVPGYVVAAARGSQLVECLVHGTDAAGHPLTQDSLFPIASITKLATALAVLRLVDAGEVTVDDPLARHLSDAAAARPGVTIRRLLTHSSGLPGGLSEADDPYEAGLDWPALAQGCLRTSLERPPGTLVSYSSVGYGLLAVVVERITRQPFAEALNTLVFEPLHIEAYLCAELPRQPAKIGDIGYTGDPSHEPFNTAFSRKRGELVTTAQGTVALVQAFRGIPADFLRPETATAATGDQTGGLKGDAFGVEVPHLPWGLGPILRHGLLNAFFGNTSTFGPRSFGMGGYTGCITWADPETDVAMAILSSRCSRVSHVPQGLIAISEAILARGRELASVGQV